jgi:hypothetical protein
MLRSAQPSHPMHGSAVRALEVLMKKDEPLVIAVQNVAEFWNAATRPAVNNGLEFTIEEAQAELAKIEGFSRLSARTPHHTRHGKPLWSIVA